MGSTQPRSNNPNQIPNYPPPPYPSPPSDQPPQYPPNSPYGYQGSDQRIAPNQHIIPMMLGGPPYLPPLTKGQKIKSGPYTVTVTDSMAAHRERQNQEIYRTWLEMQQRAAAEPEEEYYAEFKHAKIRRTFVRKVFFILFIQFLFTTLYITFFMIDEPAKIFIEKHWYLWILALITFMCSYCTISLSQCGRQQSGWGVLCLLLLTLAESHISAYVTIHYDVEIVLITMGTTAIVTFILTLAATCCACDFTKWAGLLGIFVLVCTITIFVLIFTLMFTHIPVLITILGAVGALIFSLYLYFDIQTIMGGRRIEVGPNEVIFATTQLYVDIMGLYRYLLILIGGMQPRS